MTIRELLIPVLVKSNQFNIRVLQWLARDHPAVKATLEGAHTEYVEPLAGINTAVLLAVFTSSHLDSDHQARLNACMESLRGTKIVESGTLLMGQLIASGYPVEEAFVRVIANAVELGMRTEKRLHTA